MRGKGIDKHHTAFSSFTKTEKCRLEIPSSKKLAVNYLILPLESELFIAVWIDGMHSVNDII